MVVWSHRFYFSRLFLMPLINISICLCIALILTTGILEKLLFSVEDHQIQLLSYFSITTKI